MCEYSIILPGKIAPSLCTQRPLFLHSLLQQTVQAFLNLSCINQWNSISYPLMYFAQCFTCRQRHLVVETSTSLLSARNLTLRPIMLKNTVSTLNYRNMRNVYFSRRYCWRNSCVWSTCRLKTHKRQISIINAEVMYMYVHVS